MAIQINSNLGGLLSLIARCGWLGKSSMIGTDMRCVSDGFQHGKEGNPSLAHITVLGLKKTIDEMQKKGQWQ